MCSEGIVTFHLFTCFNCFTSRIRVARAAQWNSTNRDEVRNINPDDLSQLSNSSAEQKKKSVKNRLNEVGVETVLV